ncbi:pilus assembly FimT family protein [Deinococcus ruber]|uniref:Uncharacterized protein n=1 Tax=Deinococcus ruber TaxID=1848197 RepID=A0A918FHY4_9DEIO|nr:type II secretion system GspH family protein [Deinococcus ruber]GGR38561.1 hypothetical protein GCM10008957_54570 [Deinococcus ruber]
MKRRIAALTLMEVLVTIVLIGLTTTIAVTQLPRLNHPVDQATLAQRVATTLEAAHVQAISDRNPIHVVAQGTQLSISSPDTTDTDTFAQATLSGTLDITPDGSSTGVVTVNANNFPCTLVALNASGLPISGSCSAGLPAPEPSTVAADANPTPVTPDPVTTLPPDTTPAPTFPTTPAPIHGGSDDTGNPGGTSTPPIKLPPHNPGNIFQ